MQGVGAQQWMLRQQRMHLLEVLVVVVLVLVLVLDKTLVLLVGCQMAAAASPVSLKRQHWSPMLHLGPSAEVLVPKQSRVRASSRVSSRVSIFLLLS